MLSENPWNSGMVEYWGLKTVFILILISVLRVVSKKKINPFEPTIPTFQYSIIPRLRASAQSIFSDLAQKTEVSVLE